MPCFDPRDYNSEYEVRQELNARTAELCYVRKWIVKLLDPQQLSKADLDVYNQIVREHSEHREQDRKNYITGLTRDLREFEDVVIRLKAIDEDVSDGLYDKIDSLKKKINDIIQLPVKDFLKGHPEF